MNNKIMGRQMMQHCKKLGLIAPEQYGSRKNKSAIKHATNKVLAYDITRQQKSLLAMCVNDAKSCYDRIVHAFMSLVLQSKGVQEPPIVCELTTLQNLTNTIRTAYGTSDLSYGGELWVVPIHGEANGDTTKGPPQGLGQGNGMAPTAWAVVSTPFLEVMQKEGFTTVFKALISDEQIQYVGYAFVDDADILATPEKPEDTYVELGNHMQDGMNLWEGSVTVSGGGMVVPKSYWYLIDFKWKEGIWSYKSVSETPFELRMQGWDGRVLKLDRLEASQARRSLGLRSPPDGNNKAQVRYLRSVAKGWRDKMRTGHLNKFDAWTALTTQIMKTIEYPLQALTLTKEECTYIMEPIMVSGLNGIGVCRNLPRVVAYAPVKYQGIGVKDPYTTMCIRHMELLMEDTRWQTYTGGKLRISLEAMKVEVGIGGSVLTQDYTKYGCLATKCIVQHTWRFLHENEMMLEDKVGELEL